MKKILTLLLGSVALLLSSCKHDEPVSQKYFEVEIDPNYSTDQTDNWIMLHDQNGVFLDAKHFENGDNLTFETTRQIPNNKIAITQLTVSPNSSSFTLQTFLCEDTHAKWALKSSSNNFDKGTKIGTLNVTINDPQYSAIGINFDAYLSTKSDNIYSLANSSNVGSFAFYPTDITTTIDSFFVFAYDQNNSPHYKFLENVTPGDFTYALSDLNSFDNILSVNLPTPNYFNYLRVDGYENDTDLSNSQSYVVDFSLDDATLIKPIHSTFNIGFLNRFKKYKVYINSITRHYGLSYESLGNEPTSISMPSLSSFNAAVTDKSFNNYTVSSVDYTWRSTSWGYTDTNNTNNYISWGVIASPEYFKNPGEIPKIILDQYPFLKNGVLYNSSTFYKIDKPWSYVLGKYSGTTDLTQDYTQISKTVSDY